ncbi:unnamed protein product [Prunus armeniaca]|uniref:Ubiquitin-like protease family profile domain-containing protein n=1 Tax=Prunus armeniaca TaxID=36596 RepID=A0A6J5X7W2_PRUAR|nr:unnamed protein product [Prunus armeniaca]
MNIDMELHLLQERHNRCGKWVGSELTILDMTFQAYMGKEDKKHSNGLLRMVKGEVPKLAKPWSSVKHVFMSFNLQRQKHWILLVFNLNNCEIMAYDSKINLCRT